MQDCASVLFLDEIFGKGPLQGAKLSAQGCPHKAGSLAAAMPLLCGVAWCVLAGTPGWCVAGF
jgi:hypothetical protein